MIKSQYEFSIPGQALVSLSEFSNLESLYSIPPELLFKYALKNEFGVYVKAPESLYIFCVPRESIQLKRFKTPLEEVEFREKCKNLPPQELCSKIAVLGLDSTQIQDFASHRELRVSHLASAYGIDGTGNLSPHAPTNSQGWPAKDIDGIRRNFVYTFSTTRHKYNGTYCEISYDPVDHTFRFEDIRFTSRTATILKQLIAEDAKSEFICLDDFVFSGPDLTDELNFLIDFSRSTWKKTAKKPFVRHLDQNSIVAALKKEYQSYFREKSTREGTKGPLGQKRAIAWAKLIRPSFTLAPEPESQNQRQLTYLSNDLKKIVAIAKWHYRQSNEKEDQRKATKELLINSDVYECHHDTAIPLITPYSPSNPRSRGPKF